ncbi:tyrosine-type recombinase/integrase [Paraherbaspirillum soli]|uniref:Tyrosine-type recombinase/integrase n=1 Tax=Paraherbaspirillum soli TaxID=631222 RepID=A0ABW0M6E9_9BURK
MTSSNAARIRPEKHRPVDALNSLFDHMATMLKHDKLRMTQFDQERTWRRYVQAYPYVLAKFFECMSASMQIFPVKDDFHFGFYEEFARLEGQLATIISRIEDRNAMSLMLVNNKDGGPMTASMLRGAFDRAREAAKMKHPELAAQIKAFQFRDLRAKAGTDKEESQGMSAAQDQLGHSTPVMTAHYVRHRRGKLVAPTK